MALLVALLAQPACGPGPDGPADTVNDTAPDAVPGQDSPGDSARLVTYRPHTYLFLPDAAAPQGQALVADPHVIKIGPTWYLYGTWGYNDLSVWLSEDLDSWSNGGVAWHPTPGSWNDQGKIWAPHVEPAGDSYYLYYSANMRIGVARSSSPLGPFTEVYDHALVGDGYGGVGDGESDGGPLGFDPEESAIDAFVLAGVDGSLTMYFAAYKPQSCIFGLPMVNHATVSNQPPRELICPDLTGWEGFVNEGPWVVERDGRYLLMYSGNGANTINYAVGYATADDPLGPFVKSPGNPILRTNPDAGFWGPGHHSLARGAFDDVLIFYHTKLGREAGWDRNVRYAPVTFDDGGVRLEVPQP
jgi:beta-xylosidase